MARPEKESCDFFFTSTKLLYDTKIKALRRSFKDSDNANNAFFVFDYLFREIFGNEGYYIKYNDDLVGDTADFCYLSESFVRAVIEKCADIGLFHKGQFEENGILTSRAIQRKYEKITEKRKRSAIESEFCVLDEELMSSETELMSSETELMSSESTHRKERKERKERKGECDFVLPFAEESPVMQRVRSVIADTAVADAIREWIRLMYDSRKMQFNETSIDLHLQKLLELSTDPHKQLFSVNLAIMSEWKGFYHTDTKSKGKSSGGKKAGSRIIQPDEEVGTWTWKGETNELLET